MISLLYNWMFLSSVISYYTTNNSSSMLAFPKLIILKLAPLITLSLKSQVRLLQQAQFGANTFFFMLGSHHPLSRICLEIMLRCFLRVSFPRVSESVSQSQAGVFFLRVSFIRVSESITGVFKSVLL